MVRPLPLLAALTFAAAAIGQQPSPRQPDTPTDLTVTNMTINEATGLVAVSVRFDSRIGLRGVKVRLSVSGPNGASAAFTQPVDLPPNGTRTAFFRVPFQQLKAQVAQPFQAIRFLAVTATVDPDKAVGEDNEINNRLIRVVNF